MLDRRLTFNSVAGLERTVWGERRESTPGDDLVIAEHAQTWNQEDAVYRVRSLGDVKYEMGQQFTDEDGELRTIRGLRKVGRTHFEVLARRV